MTTVKVEFEVKVPETVSRADIEEWIRFELKANAQMNEDNPLFNRELEAISSSVVIMRLL